MNMENLSLDEFLLLPQEKIRQILTKFGRPRLGVFVPDGSRRLVLAYTDYPPESNEFYRASAELPARFILKSLKIFFDYGLPVLLTPILGRSILKRGSKYRAITLLEGLRILFQSPETLALYHDYQIRVRVYGQPDILKGTECEAALEWIGEACRQTSHYSQYKLFYAIGEPPVVGEQASEFAATYALQHGRIPTASELIRAYYGEDLPPADFFIMTSKMSGMGALPNWLVNGDTEVYFLPTLMGLTERNYRLILYDMIYNRNALRAGIDEFDNGMRTRLELRQIYDLHLEKVIGIGINVGRVWIMVD